MPCIERRYVVRVGHVELPHLLPPLYACFANDASVMVKSQSSISYILTIRYVASDAALIEGALENVGYFVLRVKLILWLS